MSDVQYRDQLLRCTECGTGFLYTASEQRRRAESGRARDLPLLCPGCRALNRLVAEKRARERSGEELETGRVKWFDPRKGFGFLLSENGEKLFFHRSSLPDGRRGVRRGQRVQFMRQEGKRGPEAVHLQIMRRQGRQRM